MSCRTIGIVFALVLGASSVAPTALARQAPPKTNMTFIGYRVLVEPEIVEARNGRLMTRGLLWKFRAVFEDPRTRQKVHVVTRLQGAEDSYVEVRRPWERADVPRSSRVFSDGNKALRRYSGLRGSQDISLIGPQIALAKPRPKLTPKKKPAPPKPPPPPDCKAILLKKGHNAMHLRRCEGADPYCAAALLRAGQSPINLSKCKTRDLTRPCVEAMMRNKISAVHLDRCAGVEPHCAVSLLNAKKSWTHLRKCRKNLNRRCVTALFKHKHSGAHLDRCAGVDGKCAELLLAKQSPIHLRNCRK